MQVGGEDNHRRYDQELGLPVLQRPVPELSRYQVFAQVPGF